MPICSDGPICWAPLILMVPEVQRSSPAIRRRRVVLPQPDAPTTVMNSPAPTRKLALSRARTRSPEALLNVFETAASSITGVAARSCVGVDIAWPWPSRWVARRAALKRDPSKKYDSPTALLARPAAPGQAARAAGAARANSSAQSLDRAQRNSQSAQSNATQHALFPRWLKRAQATGECPSA